jgi:hypothetical protein
MVLRVLPIPPGSHTAGVRGTAGSVQRVEESAPGGRGMATKPMRGSR